MSYLTSLTLKFNINGSNKSYVTDTSDNIVYLNSLIQTLDGSNNFLYQADVLYNNYTPMRRILNMGAVLKNIETFNKTSITQNTINFNVINNTSAYNISSNINASYGGSLTPLKVSLYDISTNEYVYDYTSRWTNVTDNNNNSWTFTSSDVSLNGTANVTIKSNSDGSTTYIFNFSYTGTADKYAIYEMVDLLFGSGFYDYVLNNTNNPDLLYIYSLGISYVYYNTILLQVTSGNLQYTTYSSGGYIGVVFSGEGEVQFLSDISNVTMILIGGGGNGGDYASNSTGASTGGGGGGGGGGVYVTKYNIIYGSSYDISVGGIGQSTTFNSSELVAGGGGNGGSPSGTAGGVAGSQGTSSFKNISNVSLYNGGNGGKGGYNSSGSNGSSSGKTSYTLYFISSSTKMTSGGGGAGAGTSGSTNYVGGAGAGSGGKANQYTSSSTNGKGISATSSLTTGYGGGGGGAAYYNGVNNKGGQGGQGVFIMYWKQ